MCDCVASVRSGAPAQGTRGDNNTMMESDTPHVYIAPLNHRCAHAVYAHYIMVNESEQLHCEICDLSKKYEYEYL